MNVIGMTLLILVGALAVVGYSRFVSAPIPHTNRTITTRPMTITPPIIRSLILIHNPAASSGRGRGRVPHALP